MSDETTIAESVPAAPVSDLVSALDDAWVIFGASSGIAREFARVAAQHGKPLVLAGRDVEDLSLDGRDLVLRGSPAVRTVPFDADAPEGFAAVAAMLDSALPQSFNVLLAFAVLPRPEDIARDPDLARRVMATNSGAPMALLQHLAPLMQRRGSGRLMVLGSVAGDRVRPGNPVYGTSKMALHGFVEAIAPRLAKSGVAVTLVKPGPIDTPMTYGRVMALKAASAEGCAQAMWRAAQKKRRVVYFPAMLRWVMAVVRLLPARLLRLIDR
ncbi:MAG: SDR family NAD(P)-dependent oxidoreductase [Rhodospirillales bacterium]